MMDEKMLKDGWRYLVTGSKKEENEKKPCSSNAIEGNTVVGPWRWDVIHIWLAGNYYQDYDKDGCL